MAAACSSAPAQDLAINGAPPLMANPVGPPPGPREPGPVLKNPLGNDSSAPQQGRQWFAQFNCAGCHGDHGGGGMGPSLRDGEWIYGDSDAALYGAIVEGRAHGMPAWGSRIPEPLVWQLVSYLRTLGSDVEPQGPSQIIPPPPPDLGH
ncbi:MAG TPA: c-type cytochrome [Polyangiales bacterium]|nr:c-type cytochrome [Polyangiales bacterium]